MNRPGPALSTPPTALSRPAAGELALERFLAAGFERIEPPILQPASVFLDMSGEEIRGRLYLTSDAAGGEQCLRPEYTIPVCLAYLKSARAGGVAEFSYLGPVFRAEAGQAGERTQTGLESFGRRDFEAADAEIFALAIEAAAEAGAPRLAVRLGDARLFESVLAALALPEVWRRRLRRGVAKGRSLGAILEGGSQAAISQPGVLAALESADHAGAKALVEDLLALAGIDAVGGRSAGEIADRFLEQAALRSGDPLDADKRAILERYLAIVGDPDESARQLERLAREAKLEPVGEAIAAFERRSGFIAARGMRIEDFVFAAAFVRDFDYYTGFVFEARDAGKPEGRSIVGGGRYDGLARRLGAHGDIPAVGAAIAIDRLPRKDDSA